MPKMATPLIAPLRAKLGQLGFDEPLSADSVGLVSSLLEALVSARARVDTLTATADQQASRLFTADQIGPPLRKEIARLVRENNKLHAAMIELREAAEARSREEAVAGSKANGRTTTARSTPSAAGCGTTLPPRRCARAHVRGSTRAQPRRTRS